MYGNAGTFDVNMNLGRLFGLLHLKIVFLILMGYDASSLRITSLEVPAMADPRFDEPQLTCRYHFGAEGLFTVKWYKDDREFYRYLPNFDPQIIRFPTEEIALSETGFSETKTTLEKRRATPELCNTTSCTVRLVNISKASSGEYSCEISSERPYFNTDIKSKNLTVAAPPSAPPTIEGLASSYSTGDVLSASCTTDASLPVAIVTWTINGEKPPQNSVAMIQDDTSEDRHGLSRSRSDLQFRIEDFHFRGEYSQLNLSCQATLPELGITKVSHITFTLGGYQRMILNNQKLEWNSSGSKSKVSSMAATSAVAYNFFLLLNLLRGLNEFN